MATTVLGGAIDFFQQLGVYDIVLPFILVFVMMFAFLERTKVFGTEKIPLGGHDQEVTKKGLNAAAAFTIAFLAVASNKVVATITDVSANMVIVVLMVLFLLMLVGSFYAQGEVGSKGIENKAIKLIGLIIIGFSIILIFLDGLKLDNGQSWLEYGWYFVIRYWNTAAFGSLLLMAFIIGFVWFVAGDKSGHDEGNKGHKKEDHH